MCKVLCYHYDSFECSACPIVRAKEIWTQRKRSVQCVCMLAQLLQSCMTLCDPMDCNLPGSSVHRILQARILQCVAMPSTRGFSQPRDRTCISCISGIAGRFFTAEAPGKPQMFNTRTAETELRPRIFDS